LVDVVGRGKTKEERIKFSVKRCFVEMLVLRLFFYPALPSSMYTVKMQKQIGRPDRGC
jgi:hypothetical protein